MSKHLAAALNRTGMLEILSKNSVLLSSVDSDGNTALHCAMQAGTLEAADLLLRAGISSTARNKTRQTARQLAEESKQEAALKRYDQVAAELQMAEEKVLKEQGIPGIFILKQQQIIRE